MCRRKIYNEGTDNLLGEVDRKAVDEIHAKEFELMHVTCFDEHINPS